MFYDRQDLTALIGSRICHDLISPLGAISNGLELLAMTGLADGPEIDLITQSIANANSKIRFFRVAYGKAPQGSALAQSEVVSILADYFRKSRLEVTWHPSREVQRRDAKTIFLTIQCLESAMPFGGRLDIRMNGNEWVLVAHSQKLRADSDHWALLEGQEMSRELSPSHVQFGMLLMMTQWRKPAISVDVSQDAIIVKL